MTTLSSVQDLIWLVLAAVLLIIAPFKIYQGNKVRREVKSDDQN